MNIIYGALCAMAQKDLKKLVAYSSVSHMGYVMLGMASFTTQGINGAVLQMFNHGTITGMLFLLVGVIYDRAHHRDIDGFGGLAAIMPVYTGVTALAFFASMGLARALRIHLGNPGPARHLAEISGADDSRRQRRDPDRGLFALDDPARLPRAAERKIFEIVRRSTAAKFSPLVPLGVIVIIVGIYPNVVLDMLRASLDQINQIVIAASLTR